MAAEKTERNLDIVRRREAGETLDAIATRYGISRERVKQLYFRAHPELAPPAHGTPEWEARRAAEQRAAEQRAKCWAARRQD